MSAALNAVRECARDHARVCRAVLLPTPHNMSPPEFVTPGTSPRQALDVYAHHILPLLPRAKLEGLARFFRSSLRRVPGGSVNGDMAALAAAAPDELVTAAGASDAAAARFLACAAYYLSPRVGPPGIGASAGALLLLKK